MNKNLIITILICIALAMGVAVVVLCIMTKGYAKDLLSMLGIATICLSLASLLKSQNNKENK